MAKVLNTYALFDVAKEKVLSLVSSWRTTELGQTLGQSLKGNMHKCQDAGEASLFQAWRTGDAKDAALLTICAHGAQASVDGCGTTGIYVAPDSATYPEVPGAVIHLVACESLDDLAPELVQRGGAAAVIAYNAPVVLRLPPGQEIDDHTAVLPEALQITMQFDNEILIALANRSTTVEQAIDRAKQWETARIAQLDQEIVAEVDSDRQSALRRARANLESNAAALGYCGNKSAVVTQ